jgi:hypothetical protein
MAYDDDKYASDYENNAVDEAKRGTASLTDK